MRKNYYPGSLLLLCLLYAATANAQTDQVAVNTKNSFLYTAEGKYAAVSGIVTAVNIYAVPIKAVRDFMKTFNKSQDIQWYKLEDGYTVLYTHDGHLQRTGYDSKGNWLYNLFSYSAEKLPEDVYRLVRSTYYDFSITQVDEIQQRKQVIYIIHMEDKRSWQNLRVVDGEMEIIEQYNK